MRAPRITSVVKFGRLLFNTADLDPVYVALNKLQLPPAQLGRWLVAYWCFYHSGFACWASERSGLRFWTALWTAAANEAPSPAGNRWPRGTERRHFRGRQAVIAVETLRKMYWARPEVMVERLAIGKMDVASVIERAKRHPMFGPWIAFKVADMLDAVCAAPVEQTSLEVFLYDTPRNSILEGAEHNRIPEKLQVADEDVLLTRAMHWLRDELDDVTIPHKPGKKPDWFSLETVWCKHHSHLNGHYPIGKDCWEIRHGMSGWVDHSETAERFRAALPPVPVEYFRR